MKKAALRMVLMIAMVFLVTSTARAQESRIMTAAWDDAPLSAVASAFASFSGKTIVIGRDVGNPRVTAELRNVDWRQGLETVLEALGLVARDEGNGIIRITRRDTSAR